MPADSDPLRAKPPGASPASPAELAELRLLHLADTALPIGSLAHSFGLESLVTAGILDVHGLFGFLRGYLEEAGALEAVFCRAAFRLAADSPRELATERWLEVNIRMSALKPARESRAGSAALGRNFLTTVLALGETPVLREALDASRKPPVTAVHHSLAFGLVSGALGFEEDRAVLAYLHQSAANLVSACQRLLPLGQTEAARILWHLKPVMIETAARSAAADPESASCFMPLLDWGAMEHPALATRLFVS
ncbi:MAG TPA: urease accessory UreF family protein [Candidatus Acidoferrales bacterium]|jgi:urease accessory protein|nr:urease accessory UreF family protein [Candidatus Acidoferrales bacterium]